MDNNLAQVLLNTFHHGTNTGFETYLQRVLERLPEIALVLSLQWVGGYVSE